MASAPDPQQPLRYPPLEAAPVAEGAVQGRNCETETAVPETEAAMPAAHLAIVDDAVEEGADSEVAQR